MEPRLLEGWGGICPPPGLVDEESADKSPGALVSRPLPPLGSFDSDIIEWMKKDKKFCLEVQKMLDQLVGDCFTHEKTIPDVKDTFKRKLIHKLCDRYGLSREVDAKRALIVIKKTPATRRPKQSLKDYFNDYCAVKKTIPEKKIKIRTRDDLLGTNLHKQDLQSVEATKDQAYADLQKNQQLKLHELSQKNEKYLQMKSKYLIDDDNFEEIFLSEKTKQQLLFPNSKLKLTSPSYDPEFIRDPMPATLAVTQSAWHSGYGPGSAYFR